ncbi:hypothetical protein BJY52DRAFT_1317496 [Lactarius psammicola]|nr:hypothetical protein BJY52DRAFT_1317496 [Lactarius psammicola]
MCTSLATVNTDLKPIPFSPINPRVDFSRVLVLWPISHIALTSSAEKPTSLHSNTTRLCSIWRFNEGMTSSAYALSSAFCMNSSKKWVFLLYKSLESRSRARSSLPRSLRTAGEGFEWSSSKPYCSRMMWMSLEAAWVGREPSLSVDMMEANREGESNMFSGQPVVDASRSSTSSLRRVCRSDSSQLSGVTTEKCLKAHPNF